MIDCTLSEEEVNPGVDLVKRQIGKRWATRQELFPHIYAMTIALHRILSSDLPTVTGSRAESGSSTEWDRVVAL